MRIGSYLSCEELSPRELLEQARRAEAAGFHALWLSDHYHPWNDRQGHSGFVWSLIRTLWRGGQHSHHGRHYTVENARIYDLPDEPPPGELAQVLPTPAHFEQACEPVRPELTLTLERT